MCEVLESHPGKGPRYFYMYPWSSYIPLMKDHKGPSKTYEASQTSGILGIGLLPSTKWDRLRGRVDSGGGHVIVSAAEYERRGLISGIVNCFF